MLIVMCPDCGSPEVDYQPGAAPTEIAHCKNCGWSGKLRDALFSELCVSYNVTDVESYERLLVEASPDLVKLMLMSAGTDMVMSVVRSGLLSVGYHNKMFEELALRMIRAAIAEALTFLRDHAGDVIRMAAPSKEAPGKEIPHEVADKVVDSRLNKKIEKDIGGTSDADDDRQADDVSRRERNRVPDGGGGKGNKDRGGDLHPVDGGAAAAAASAPEGGKEEDQQKEAAAEGEGGGHGSNNNNSSSNDSATAGEGAGGGGDSGQG